MSEGRVRNGDVELWFEDFGDPAHSTVLLVAGATDQAVFWEPYFYEPLLKAGYRVVRYDNRDIGLSTWIDYEKDPYTIPDMAGDAIAVLDALEQLSQTVGLYPDTLLPHIFLFRIYLDLEREAEAVAQVREMETIYPRPSPSVAARRALVGETAEAEVELREAIELSDERYVSPFRVAEAWAALGETEHAFEWLERAYEERSPIPSILWNPAFHPMRPDPRFQDLLRRIGFPEG